ncbi:hypothetical protein ABK040_003791 [Willaertia magna]
MSSSSTSTSNNVNNNNDSTTTVAGNTLSIQIISAKDLGSRDLNGFSDPYVVITILTSDKKKELYKKQTKVIEKNLNPIFNENFKFPFIKGNENIILEVLDWDRFMKHDSCGKIESTVNELLKKQSTNKEMCIDLQYCNRGKLNISISFENFIDNNNTQKNSSDNTLQQNTLQKDQITKKEPEIVNLSIDDFIDYTKKQITTIDNTLQQMSQKMSTIKLNIDKLSVETNPKQLIEIQKEIRLQLSQVVTLQQTCQHDLNSLQNETNDLKKELQEHSIIRLRESQYKNLFTNFINLLEEFHTLQSEFKKKQMDRIKRSQRAKTLVNSNHVENDVENDENTILQQALENSENSTDCSFENAFSLTASQSSTLDVELQLAREANEDIKNCYYGMLQLKQLFIDFSNLVEQQDELLDSIEMNVRLAKEHVIEGVKLIKDSNHLREMMNPLGLAKNILAGNLLGK